MLLEKHKKLQQDLEDNKADMEQVQEEKDKICVQKAEVSAELSKIAKKEQDEKEKQKIDEKVEAVDRPQQTPKHEGCSDEDRIKQLEAEIEKLHKKPPLQASTAPASAPEPRSRSPQAVDRPGRFKKAKI